jgi:hypothetical protein
MTNRSDALHFSGFQGCASDREFYWHLAADHPEQWDRFPKAHSYDWHPEQDQCSLPPYDQDALVVDLVENGGWLLIGDSVTENHFFSLSCMLYPHVRATPNYTENPYFDRAWPQNLYLNPGSPLIPTMKLPTGFSVESTPLVTFRRVDLLLDGPDLEALYSSIYSPPPEFSLFSDEQFWSMPIKNYTDIFLAPLPEANYRTLVISTAGHWTTTVFSGLADETKVGNGIDEVLRFFTHAMEKWADEVQAILTEHGSRNKDVVVRAYLPGHDDCHNIRAPWDTILPFKREIYNWNWIHNFNEIFQVNSTCSLFYSSFTESIIQNVLSSPSYTDIHFLPIDVPARLRPDAVRPDIASSYCP